MSSHNKENLTTYNQSAKTLAASYNAVSTGDILPQFVKEISAYTDQKSYRVLDIGCGSGRDAFWLAQQGFHVVAIDASAEMLQEAQNHFSHANITYLRDDAPALSETHKLKTKFDIILMGAFLFHLDEDERQKFYESLKDIVAEKCYIHISLRYGPTPEGRKMFIVPADELAEFAKMHEMSFAAGDKTADALNRPDVSWQEFILKRPKQKL